MTELDNKKKVVLITGASSGIGKKCYDHLSEKGYKVYGTSRQEHIELLQMDVNHNKSVEQVINAIVQKESRIDVVINNAGIGMAGAIEDTSIDEARLVFETNLWGILRVCKAVLPIMRKMKSGYLINISSLGGRISVPYQGIYCASKFAVEGLTESLRMELQAFGIHVVLIEPGDLSTPFTINRRKTEASEINPAYKQRYLQALQVSESDELHGLPADKVAELLAKIIRNPNPKLRYTVAKPVQKYAPLIKKLLPQNAFERLVMKHYGIQ